MTYKISRALLSVSDKSGIIELAKKLIEYKIQILSTGGTADVLKKAGLPIMDVSAHTQFPEIMDGRIKTLHPIIHGGILADRDNKKHLSAMDTHSISPIDMVVVNLYPFTDTVKSGADNDKCIENIDIGGPTMIRSAAKNHKYITVLTNPNQYVDILKELQSSDGQTSLSTRKKLALEAFSHTAQYDANISNWMSNNIEMPNTFGNNSDGNIHLPQSLFNFGTRKKILRYGENPHQASALYSTDKNKICVANAMQLQGKPLSYNNLNDGDNAFEIVCEYSAPSCAIIKHANPCGIASGTNGADAFKKALSCDSMSAFGGILAFNCEFDINTATACKDLFLEVIVAPKFTDEAKNAMLSRSNVRLLETNGLHNSKNETIIKNINGAILLQSNDTISIEQSDCTVVTKRIPTDKEWQDLLFAYKAVKHVKSNAIVYARNMQTVGIGAGQMSRLDSADIGAQKAKAFLGTEKSVVASDAFFPFPDAMQLCITVGATAIIQPGGAKNDADVIASADEAGVAMVFTNTRHFKH